ncbi:Fc.00g091490.m01.CDS01 [Cosmosporella sp. VM-42]
MSAPASSLSDSALSRNNLDNSDIKYGFLLRDALLKDGTDSLSYFNLPHQNLAPPFIVRAFPTPTFDNKQHLHRQSPKNLREGMLENQRSSSNSTSRLGGNVPAPSPFGVDPPRPPRDGFDTSSNGKFWRWRARSNKSASESDARDISVSSPTTSLPTPYSPPKLLQQQQQQPYSPYLSESAHVFSLQHPPSGSNSDRPVDRRLSISPSDSSQNNLVHHSSSGAQTVIRSSVGSLTPPSSGLSTKGLYDRAKGIGSKLRMKALGQKFCPPIPEYECSHSTNDGTPSYREVQSTIKTSTWLTNEMNKVSFPRKLFGKAPWHRKHSGDSYSSVASSIREAVRGETPPMSPATEYTIPFGDNSSFTQFPGGEAVRIKTPPLCEDTADGRPRAFFTSMTPPGDDSPDTMLGPSPTQSTTRLKVRRKSVVKQSREWWDGMPEQKEARRTSQERAEAFEFQVPEHLPSSPMCPANPRHRSGGTGMCVYHGRRRGATRLQNVTLRDEDEGDDKQKSTT